MLTFWIIVFIISLAILVKGADWLLDSAEKIGLAMGLSPFVVGVTIVGIGTSLPELVSGFVAISKGVTEIVVANAVGSNIANILLVVGLSAVISRKLKVTKSLIDLDLPLLATATLLFLGVAFDGKITVPESILLVVSAVIYILYTIIHKDNEDEELSYLPEIIPALAAKRKHPLEFEKEKKAPTRRPKINYMDLLFLFAGMAGLLIGAKYLIDSVISLSEILGIGAGVISLAVVALGTSLPELLVSVKAAWRKKSEIALGNIFGSNIFNLLAVVGLPGLFGVLIVDEKTLLLGLPVLIIATFIFIISGISRTIHAWDGAMYLMIYAFFIGKLFNIL